MGGASNNNSGGGEGPANRYTTPKPKKKAKGLIPGFIEALKTGRESDLKKRKEAKINDSLIGTSDYQGDVKAPPTITDVLNEQKAQKERDGENTIKKVTETAPPATAVVASPTTAEVDQGTSTMMSDAEILVKNKKKARSPTILTRATGLGNSSLNTTKKTLGA